MGNYTRAMKRKALWLLEAGQTVAEVRGQLDGEAGREEDTAPYAGRPFELSDYLAAYTRGVEAREKLDEGRASGQAAVAALSMEVA